VIVLAKSKVEMVYDKAAAKYSNSDFSPSDPRYELYFADEITWHFLRKYAPKEKSCLILEAGAGTGDWAIQFAKLGYKNIVLADISMGMLNQARKRFSRLNEKVNVQFVKADIANMKEFDANTFDYVFSQYDAVSYSLRPKQAIRELARVAKRNAHVVVTLDTKYPRVIGLIESGQIKKAIELLKTNISYDPGHPGYSYPTYTLTWEELSRYFTQAGLKVLEVIGAPVFMQHVNERVEKRLRRNPKTRSILLRVELENCTNKSLADLSGHLQMVGRKE
jgi:ubiquinone/menaquinone biosynthesis C-methylase UbiE